MLRGDIVRGLNNILAAVESSQVLTVVEGVYRGLTRQTGDVALNEVLDAYQKFMLQYNSVFTAVEHDVMTVLNIDDFAQASWWAVVAACAAGRSAEGDAATIGRPLFQFRFVTNYLPRVVEMLEPTAPPANAERLTVILPEHGKFSTPLRITGAVESISILYEAFAEFGLQSNTDLVLISCDSGADKVFEFRGLPDLIGKVKELLLDLWDNTVYYREKRFAERLELASKNLPVIAEIAALEERGQIQPERAELLKRKFTFGASKFFETGASIPEMNAFASHTPRLLMAPKETLLLPA